MPGKKKKPDEPSIGEVMAYIRERIDGVNSDQEREPNPPGRTFEELRESIRLRIRQTGDGSSDHAIPAEACPVDEFFLKEHQDLLLKLFVDGANEAVCSKLMKHLNECLDCFEFFGGILRDYCNARESIRFEKESS